MNKTPNRSLPVMYDVVHQSRLLREALNSEKRRVGFILGAGCPLGIYDQSNTQSLRLIPDVIGLTDAISSGLADDRQNECWQRILAACKTGAVPNPNVEHALTQVRTICAIRGGNTVDGMSREELLELDRAICKRIAEIVGVPLPKHRCSYHRFAAWLRHIERSEPIEIYTPNYDLLIEEAFEHHQIPFFDGFVGSKEPFFDVLSLELDELPVRWAKLWKLHGSINWIKREDDTVYRRYPIDTTERLLIYPSHLKYEQSRRMPYLAMLDRLRAFFRTSHSALVICGYSFADDHLNEILLDGLRANRTIHCYGLMYGKLGSCQAAVGHALRHPNLTLLCSDGAVVGTRQGSYGRLDEQAAPGAGYMKHQDGEAQCLLGDFHHFCAFLETQFGVANDE